MQELEVGASFSHTEVDASLMLPHRIPQVFVVHWHQKSQLRQVHAFSATTAQLLRCQLGRRAAQSATLK